MRIKVLILEEKLETWAGKFDAKTGEKGPDGLAYVAVCADMSNKGERLANTFDYRLRKEEETYKGHLEGKTVEIVLTDFEANYSGRLKGKGHIVAETVKMPLPERPQALGAGK